MWIFLVVKVIGCRIGIFFCFIGDVMLDFPEDDISLHSH